MVRLNHIKELYERESGLNLSTKRRDRLSVEVRSAYFKTARIHTAEPLDVIGKAVNRDHATVIHGLKIFDIHNDKNYFLATDIFKSIESKLENSLDYYRLVKNEIKKLNNEQLKELYLQLSRSGYGEL